MRRASAELVCIRAEAAEAPVPPAVVLERAAQSPLIEVRPKAIAEMEFCKRAFPQQKVAEAPLAAGANQQVDFGCGICAMIDLMQQAVKVLGREFRFPPGAPRGLHDAVLRRVVDRYSQEHARALRARSFALLDGPKQVLAEPVAPPDHIDPNRLLHATACFGKQILAEQTHQRSDLRRRACPIGG